MSNRWPGGLIRKTPVTPTASSAVGVWTLAEAMYWTKQGQWPTPGDPDFDYVTLLLPGNGTNGAQNNTFLDSSTNNFTITRNGDTTQGSFSPYGDLWSNYFDNSGDSLSVPDNAAFNFGTGDFTVEAWVYLTQYNSADYQPVFSNAYLFYIGGVGQVLLFNGSSEVFTGMAAGDVPINAWTHIAWVRSGSGTNNTKVYVNGVQKGQATLTASVGSANPNRIGQYSTVYFPGYISNLRVVKGTALYTSNFTPPTAPLTAITNTSLLTCQSNRFRDASTNNFAITRNGDVRVTNFAPFNPTAAYSAATNGGSGYFDGSGDYLTAPASSSWIFSGGYTLEAWVYPTASGVDMQISGTGGSGSNDQFGITPGAGTGRVYWAYAAVGNYLTTTANIPAFAWTHIAVTRSSNTLRAFVNGVQVFSGTMSATIGQNAINYIGRRSDGGNSFTGNISNLRLVNGTAVYTANFTPPTAPVTAITNTSLLLNFTNAGIVDASAKNDLVTVGNAQISTAQSKFGGSSMYFDGSGDYAIARANPNLEFGTGDFTLEAWVYRTSSTGGAPILTNMDDFSTNNNYFFLGYTNSNVGYFEIRTTGGSTSVLGTISGGLNTWVHLAVTRQSGTVRLFVNGVLDKTATMTAACTQRAVVVGGFLYASPYAEYFPGYIDDLRVTKGIARYTANFTPPTAPFLLK